MKATIKHSDSTRTDRVRLELLPTNGRYAWHAQAEGEEQYETDVSGETFMEAIELAAIAWGAECWDLQIEPITIELQFRGYQPQQLQFPLAESKFEHVADVAEANDIILNALAFGAFDRYGWVSADAKGEEFQVREVVQQ